ncbi:MAG: PLP-dependent aminotransferase family protein, partial [bacterium]
MTGTFSYEGLFSAGSSDEPIPGSGHAKYDFATAYPAPETLPLEGLMEGLRRGLEREGRDLAYYPVPLGSPELRALVAEKLYTDRGFRVSPDQILLTHGSGEANVLVIQALTNRGDTVITEEYVYMGTLRQLRNYGADVVGTPIDDLGIIPEALEELIVRLSREGRRPKYLYSIPEFQNPTGSTLPVERRREILEIAGCHGMPIIEDDCYVDLRIEGEAQPSFRSLDDSG